MILSLIYCWEILENLSFTLKNTVFELDRAIFDCINKVNRGKGQGCFGFKVRDKNNGLKSGFQKVVAPAAGSNGN